MDKRVNSDLKMLIERGLKLCKDVMELYEEIIAWNYFDDDMFRNR